MFGLKETLVVLLLTVGVVGVTAVYIDELVALAVFLIMVPVLFQLRRLGPEKTDAARPEGETDQKYP